MSRTRRSDYPRTGKAVGYGEYPEDFRIRQKRGLVKNSIFDHEELEEIWGPKLKKDLKRKRAKKERRINKQKLKKI
ncbi:MAG: hypothetical protein ACTSWK_01985 [Promethearchaeota archaeon]